MADVALRSLSFTYPGSAEPTLRDLNLEVANGTTHALLGASGAGKTTILSLLCGLLQPTQGQILFDGKDVSAVHARSRNVALVFQFPVLYESKSVLDNLTFPLLNRGWSKAQAKTRAQDIAAELELSETLAGRPSELSLFQKQLAAIGKSLVRPDVDLVLLDEPLTAVEPAMKWRLRQTLGRFQAHHSLTMVYVTHDQTEALTFASRVSVMADGRILQTGTPEEIYSAPADEFVGNFIGSPGMRFVDCALHNGQVTPPSSANDFQRIGFRAEWLTPSPQPDGAWCVSGVRLLGTHQGAAKSLLTLQQAGIELVAEGLGAWTPGDRASLHAEHFVDLRPGNSDAE